MFLEVLFYQIGTTIENRVRGIVAQVEKEGLVLVALDEIDRFQVETIGQVFVFPQPVLRDVKPPDGLGSKNIWPKVRPIAHPFDFTPEIPVEAMISRSNLELGVLIFVAGEVPLPNHPGTVSVAFKDFGKRKLTDRQGIGRVGSKIVENANAGWVLSGQ